jgi:imidazolonepropionase-like amidohydrolase
MSSFRRVLIALFVLFAAGAAWFAVASSGYPDALEPRRKRPSMVRVDHARLISMVPGAARVQEDHSVLMIDGVIDRIGPTRTFAIPSDVSETDVLVIDAAGRTLLPGLIDAHVHVWDEAELAAYLAHGVTSVRNMSGMPFHLSLIARIEEERILGPDISTTGPILNSPGPNQQPNHRLITTAEEARAAVAEQHEAGYRTLKLYSNLEREPYEAILKEADRLSLSITGHTPEGTRGPGVPFTAPFDISFEDVLDDDFVSIEHVESIVWHGLSGRLDEAAMRALAKRIAASQTVVTATLIAHDNLVRVAESDGAYLQRAGVETINPVIRWLEADTYEFWSAQDPAAREGPRAEFYRRATAILHQEGVTIIAGTDAGVFTNIPGSALTRELELLVEAGLTPYEALAAATALAAPVIGFPDRGQVAPGFAANLVLVDGDPLSDVSVLEQPEGVMVRGVWLDDKDLNELHRASRQASVARTVRHIAGMFRLW